MITGLEVIEMVKRTGPTNLHLKRLIRKLKKQSKNTGKGLWKRAAELLCKPRRQKIAVNLNKIDRYSEPGGTVLVPGKVLGHGKLTHEVKVAAYVFSSAALKKIREAKGEALTMEELIERNPEGKRVKILR